MFNTILNQLPKHLWKAAICYIEDTLQLQKQNILINECKEEYNGKCKK